MNPTTTQPKGFDTSSTPLNFKADNPISLSTPVNTNPSASSLIGPNSNPITIPSPSTLPNAHSVIGNAGSLFGNTNTAQTNGQQLTNSQSALLQTSDANAQSAQDTYNTDKTQTQSLVQQYLGQGADQLKQEQDAGVPQLQTASNQLTQQYYAQQNAYNQQYKAIINNPGLTKEQSAQQIDALTQQHGYDLTNTSIQQSIAQNDYNNAESIIQHQIQLKYGALKDAITFGQNFMATDANLLSAKQQNQFSANLAVQQQMYTQQTYYAQLNASTSMDLLKNASANGAPQDVIQSMGQKIASGASYADVAAAGGQYTANGNYTPVQTGIDLNTGLPIYSGFNAKTGQLEVKNPNNSLGVTGSADTIVNGVQLGVGTTLGAYAQNDNGTVNQQQITNVKAADAKIQSTVGQVTDAKTAQFALDAVSKNSPITGQMIMNAAQEYPSVPISTAIAVMQAETQCGTDKSKGSQLCNFGNVGNTNQVMKDGKPVGFTPQEGVNAVFANLAKRTVQSNQIDPAQPGSDGKPLSPQQIAQQTISAAPALLQPAMAFTASNGSTYIDSSKVPSSLQLVAQSYASNHQIPLLNADQVSVIKGADEAIRNITNVIAPAWSQIAVNNRNDTQLNNIQYGGISKALDTTYYQNRNAFDSNRESLAGQIRALSQSAPKGSLLSTAEAALPSSSEDTLKDGNAKMQRTLDLLNQTMQTFLPGAQPVTLPQPQTSLPQSYALSNGQVVHLQADGKTYQ